MDEWIDCELEVDEELERLMVSLIEDELRDKQNRGGTNET